MDRRIPFRSSKRVLDRPKRNEEEQVLRPPGSCLPPGTPRFDSPRPVSSSSIPPSPPPFLVVVIVVVAGSSVNLPTWPMFTWGCTRCTHSRDVAFKPRLRKPCNSAATWLMSGGPAIVPQPTLITHAKFLSAVRVGSAARAPEFA